MEPSTQNLIMNPKEFFRGRLHEASESLKICLDDELEFYLVNLLCEFINPQVLNDAIGQDVLDTPLAFLLKKAQELELEEERIRALRRLGDTSLYVAGYFQDFFNRKIFDIGYYIEMGTLAYGSVSELMQKRTEVYDPSIYFELANNFAQLVEIIAEVSVSGDHVAYEDILAIYDRWNRSNSERLRKVLQKLGIDPIKVSTKHAQ